MKWFLIALILYLPFVGRSGDMTIAQTDCTFTLQTEQPVELWSTPIGGSSGVIMQTNQTYPIVRVAVLGDSYPAYEFQIEEGVTGWYEVIILGDLSDDCDPGPMESVTVAEFPGVCEATITEATMLFFDPELTEIGRGPGQATYLTLPEGRRFLTIGSTAISAIVYGGHAMYIGTVASHHLEFDPDCPEKPFITTITARTLEGARLWSNPHVQLGELTADVPAGTILEIMAGPVTGIITDDGGTEGEWYLVHNQSYGTGWIWSARLILNSDFPPEEIGMAQAMANTRIWSQPDVTVGTYLGDIPENAFTRLLDGPVEGRIRVDTDDIGDWYWVQTGDRTITGWVWAGRLAIQQSDE
jgi:hypothetical protein